jgi:hypothetical protein
MSAVTSIRSMFEMLRAVIRSFGEVMEALNMILRVLGKLIGN